MRKQQGLQIQARFVERWKNQRQIPILRTRIKESWVLWIRITNKNLWCTCKRWGFLQLQMRKSAAVIHYNLNMMQNNKDSLRELAMTIEAYGVPLAIFSLEGWAVKPAGVSDKAEPGTGAA